MGERFCLNAMIFDKSCWVVSSSFYILVNCDLKTHMTHNGLEERRKTLKKHGIERFNRTFREESLDACLFHALEEVQVVVQQWLDEYNAIRPREALSRVPPYQFTINSLSEATYRWA